MLVFAVFFRFPGNWPTCECCLARHGAVRPRQKLLVPFVARETDSHLRDDARQHGTQPLVQTEGSLPLHDLGAGGEETAGFCLERENGTLAC